MKAGWEESTIGDVVSKIETVDPTKKPQETFTYIDVSSVSNESFEIVQTSEVLGVDAPSRARRCIRASDVIFATIRPTLKRIATVPQSLDNQVCSTGYMVLRAMPKLHPRFLFHYLFSARFQAAMEKLQTGASYPAVTDGQVKLQPIPLPPLEEQQRIVAVLDEAFEGLARARANAEANLQNARELFESFLSGLMASNSDGWTTYSFGDQSVLKIVDGDRGANYPKKSDFMPDGYCLFLSTKNVKPDGFNFDETMFISPERDQALKKGKLKPRDVLLTTRGTIGNIAFFDETVPFEHIRINSGMLVLRPNEEKIRAEFLFELLRSSVIKEQIVEHVSGAAQPQLPIRSLVKFNLPAPKSTAEQLHIVDQLKRLSDETTRLQESYRVKLQDLDDLRQSLMQKAFAGELT